MRKSTRLIKRLIALILVFFLSIESFAAIVGDNDGAAFITKAEFDSLKNTFQVQIDQYYTSLDNKIDGAIASYLSGVKIGKKTDVKIPTTGYKDIYWQDYFLSKVKWGQWNNDGSIKRNFGTTDEEVHRVHGSKLTCYRYDYGAALCRWQRAYAGIIVNLYFDITDMPTNTFIAGDGVWNDRNPLALGYWADQSDDDIIQLDDHWVSKSRGINGWVLGGTVEPYTIFSSGPYQNYQEIDGGELYSLGDRSGILFGSTATLTPQPKEGEQLFKLYYEAPFVYYRNSAVKTYKNYLWMYDTNAENGNPHSYALCSFDYVVSTTKATMQTLNTDLLGRLSTIDISKEEAYRWTNQSKLNRQTQIWNKLGTAYYDDGIVNVYMNRFNEKHHTDAMNNNRNMFAWDDAIVRVRNWELQPWRTQKGNWDGVDIQRTDEWEIYRDRTEFDINMKLPKLRYKTIGKVKTGYVKKGDEYLSISQGICLLDKDKISSDGELQIKLKYEKGNSNNDTISDTKKIKIDLAEYDFLTKDVDNKFIIADVEYGTTKAENKEIKKYEVNPNDHTVTLTIEDTSLIDGVWMRLSPINNYGTATANCDYVQITDLSLSMTTNN